jgi:hypothetical protein
MDNRLKNINLAVLDMPAPAKPLLEKAAMVSKEMEKIKLQLYGDMTKARREFETPPSVNDRIGTIEYAVWNSTAPIPQLYKDNYEIAAKQLSAVLAEMKKVDTTIASLEKELEVNNAPYTQGRWPDWR